MLSMLPPAGSLNTSTLALQRTHYLCNSIILYVQHIFTLPSLRSSLSQHWFWDTGAVFKGLL